MGGKGGCTRCSAELGVRLGIVEGRGRVACRVPGNRFFFFFLVLYIAFYKRNVLSYLSVFLCISNLFSLDTVKDFLLIAGFKQSDSDILRFIVVPLFTFLMSEIC